jgi:hypothetical protein
MLERVNNLHPQIIGLKASGTVIGQDILQAIVLTQKEKDVGQALGVILDVDPDLDGYLSEIVSELDTLSQGERALFQRWALVVPDEVVSEAEQYRTGKALTIFPHSKRSEAIVWAASKP